jgi:hypothetical protein
VSRLVDKLGPATLGRTGVAAFETVQVHAAYMARYLRLDNKQAYEVGNGCGTCQFWFTRLEGANHNISVDELRQRLTEGLTSATDVAVERFSGVLGTDRYLVLLMDILPRLVEPNAPDGYFAAEQTGLWGIDGFWGLPHYPKVPYYRLEDTVVADDATLFEFLVPMYPPTWLDANTVESFIARSGTHGAPTAVALAVLDVKQPANWADDVTVNTHWCLAHFLLDGHHKVHAAATSGRPIRLLSFLAVDKGVSSEEDVDTLLRLL